MAFWYVVSFCHSRYPIYRIEYLVNFFDDLLLTYIKINEQKKLILHIKTKSTEFYLYGIGSELSNINHIFIFHSQKLYTQSNYFIIAYTLISSTCNDCTLGLFEYFYISLISIIFHISPISMTLMWTYNIFIKNFCVDV